MQTPDIPVTVAQQPTDPSLLDGLRPPGPVRRIIWNLVMVWLVMAGPAVYAQSGGFIQNTGPCRIRVQVYGPGFPGWPTWGFHFNLASGEMADVGMEYLYFNGQVWYGPASVFLEGGSYLDQFPSFQRTPDGRCNLIVQVNGCDDNAPIRDREARPPALTCKGMPVWAVSEPYICLWLRDEPMGYTPSFGPQVSLDLAYKHREFSAGYNPSLFSFGRKWNCSWISYVSMDSHSNPVVLLPGGGQITFATTNDYLTNTRLTGDQTNGFCLSLPDGSSRSYGFIVTNASGVFRQAFMTAQRDPQGRATTFFYQPYSAASPVVRLACVVDAEGGTNFVAYNATNYFSTNLVSQVTDRYGRMVSLLYDTQGRLTKIIDVAQIGSSFVYDGNDAITRLVTPYGTNLFSITETGSETSAPNGRSILVTEPDGGRQLYLYTNSAPGIASSYSSSAVPQTAPYTNCLENSHLDLRNTFHWNRKEYAALSSTNIRSFTAADFRKAEMKHWLNLNSQTVSETLSLTRGPSADVGGSTEGQKVWYDYAGKTNTEYVGTQALPLLRAQVLPEGTTSFARTERASSGLPSLQAETHSVGGAVGLRTNAFAYAQNGIDLVSATNAAGTQVLSNIFNAYHQVATNYDAAGQPTTYTYNPNGQLTSICTPSGLLTTNVYFGSGADVNRLAATYEVSGSDTYRSNAFGYHANGLLYSRTDERGLTVYTYWDNLQRLLSTWYPDLTTISNCYTALDLTATKDRLGYWTQYNYDSLRHLTNLVNANGVISRYTYCTCGSLSSETKALGTSVEQSTTYGYDLQGNRTYEYLPDNTITNWYDALGRVSVNGDGWGYRWFFYNNQGLLSTVSNSFGLEKQIIYDILDRPQYVTDQNGVTITNTYDALGRLRTRGYPDGGVEKFGYSARGLTAYTNQIGVATYYGYNAAGWKLFETNGNDEYLEYRYDSSGNLTNLIDGKRQVTAWNYDEYSRPTNKLDQAGAVAFRYTYNAANRLVDRWTPAKGDTIYVYDPVGNLTNKYSANSAVVFAYDPLNRPTTMWDAVGSTTFSYTPGGRLLTEDGPFDNDTITNTYAAALRTGLILQQPSGLWTNSFGYDGMGRLTNVASPAGAFLYAFQSPASTLITQLGLPNTSYITNRFDSVGRLTSTSLKNSSGGLLDSSVYGLNFAGQRLAFTNAAGTYVQYDYDNIGQLKVANSSLNTEDRGYACDAAWNIAYRTNNGVCTYYSVNGLNEVTGDGTYAMSYEANGNIGTMYSSSSYLSFTFDDDNQLVCVYDALNSSFRTEFVYDGLGRLRSRLEYTNFIEEGRPNGLSLPSSWALASATLYIYDGNRVIQERDAYNTPTVSYTRGTDLSGTLEGAGGIGGLLARSHGYSGGNWTTHNFYHADGNGNITYLVNMSQLMAASYRYDPFGNLISKSGGLADANVYRFSSKEFHPNTGLYYYGYRWYSPYLQRWLSRDPVNESGGINLYGFSRNDPITKLDAWGMADLTAPEWHHSAMRAFEWEFGQSGINIHDAKWGTMLPAWVHSEVHARGFIEELYAHFHPDGPFVPSSPRKFADFLRKLKNSDDFSDLFALGVPATEDYYVYRAGLRRVATGLGAFGLVASLVTASADAQSIGCHMRDFVRDVQAGQDAWAYVDALTVRHELNAHGAFAGDVAMRSMYRWK